MYLLNCLLAYLPTYQRLFHPDTVASLEAEPKTFTTLDRHVLLRYKSLTYIKDVSSRARMNLAPIRGQLYHKFWHRVLN